jgi:hypothetical protein
MACYRDSFIFTVLLFFAKYYSGDQIQDAEMDGACSTNEIAERCIQLLVENPGGKRLFGRQS